MFKVKYRDGTEEKIEAEDWRLFDEKFVLFEDKEEDTICAIHSDIIAKIEW